MARPAKPALAQRCRTHNTRLDPDAGVIDAPGSGAVNEIRGPDGLERLEQEFACGCSMRATFNRDTGLFDTVELNDRREPV